MPQRIIPQAMLILAAGFLLAASPKKGEPTDHTRIQGTWHVISVELDSRPVQRLRAMSFVFEGDQLKRDEAKYRFRLDESKDPKHLDLISENKETDLALYELDGDDLKIEFSKMIGERPGSKFGLGLGGGPVFYLKRVKR